MLPRRHVIWHSVEVVQWYSVSSGHSVWVGHHVRFRLHFSPRVVRPLPFFCSLHYDTFTSILFRSCAAAWLKAPAPVAANLDTFRPCYRRRAPMSRKRPAAAALTDARPGCLRRIASSARAPGHRPCGNLPRHTCSNYPLCTSRPINRRSTQDLSKHLQALLGSVTPERRAEIEKCCRTCAIAAPCDHPGCLRPAAPSLSDVQTQYCCTHLADPCNSHRVPWAMCCHASSGCWNLSSTATPGYCYPCSHGYLPCAHASHGCRTRVQAWQFPQQASATAMPQLQICSVSDCKFSASVVESSSADHAQQDTVIGEDSSKTTPDAASLQAAMPASAPNTPPLASASENPKSSTTKPRTLTTTPRQTLRSNSAPTKSAAHVACLPSPSHNRPAGAIPRSSAKHLPCANFLLCRNAANLDKHVTSRIWLRELLHDATPDFRAAILAGCTACAQSAACSRPERVAPSSKPTPKMKFCTIHYNNPCRIKSRDWAARRNAPSGCRELAMKHIGGFCFSRGENRLPCRCALA